MNAKVFAAADAAFRDCRDRNEHADMFKVGTCCTKAAVSAALREAAAEVVASCPDHGQRDEAWMDCHCVVGDWLRLTPAAVPVPDETAGDGLVHPSGSLGALIEAALVESKPVWWQTPPRLDWAATAVVAAMAEDAKTLLAETADVETEFAVRWPDGSLTPVTDRAHGLRAIASARRAEPGTVLIQRTCTPWTEVTS